MVLLREETSYMSEYERIWISDAEFRSHLRRKRRIISVDGSVDGIALLNHLVAVLFTEQPIPSFRAAREHVRDVLRQSHTEIFTEYGFQVESDRTVMRMCDADGNTLLRRYPQREIAAFLKIRMDNLVFRMLLEESTEFTLVPSEILRVHRAHAVDASAQRLDLILIGRMVIAIDQKIISDLLAVEMTKVIHHHGFGTTTVHNRVEYQYAQRGMLRHDEPLP